MLLVLPVLAISLLMTITLRWLGVRHAEALEKEKMLKARRIISLAAIALAPGDGELRLAAIRRLTDQAALTELAAGAGEAEIREAAIRRVTDPALLAGLATTDPLPGVRWAAVDVLDDPAVLGRIALGERDARVRARAAAKLDDPRCGRALPVPDPDHGRQRCHGSRLIDLHRQFRGQRRHQLLVAAGRRHRGVDAFGATRADAGRRACRTARHGPPVPEQRRA